MENLNNKKKDSRKRSFDRIEDDKEEDPDQAITILPKAKKQSRSKKKGKKEKTNGAKKSTRFSGT